MRTGPFFLNNADQRTFLENAFITVEAAGLPRARLKAFLLGAAINPPLHEVARRRVVAANDHLQSVCRELEQQLAVHTYLHRTVARMPKEISCDPLTECRSVGSDSRWALSLALHAQFCQAFAADLGKYSTYVGHSRTGARSDALRSAVRRLPEGAEPTSLSWLVGHLRDAGLSWKQVGFLRLASQLDWRLPLKEKPWEDATNAAKKAYSQANVAKNNGSAASPSKRRFVRQRRNQKR
jgi:hypothetical protein